MTTSVEAVGRVVSLRPIFPARYMETKLPVDEEGGIEITDRVNVGTGEEVKVRSIYFWVKKILHENVDTGEEVKVRLDPGVFPDLEPAQFYVKSVSGEPPSVRNVGDKDIIVGAQPVKPQESVELKNGTVIRFPHKFNPQHRDAIPAFLVVVKPEAK